MTNKEYLEAYLRWVDEPKDTSIRAFEEYLLWSGNEDK